MVDAFEIEANLRATLLADPRLPCGTSRCRPRRSTSRSRDGWVTLEGHVDHRFQSDEAFDDVAMLAGVAGVTNETRVADLR